MTVDVKQLRIGSHILVNGKRERIRGLDEDNGLIVRFPAEYVKTSEVRPISISPKLLKELGFEYKKDISAYYKVFIEQWCFVKKENKNWKLVLYSLNDSPQNRVILYAQHLHQLEEQLAYYGVELIEN